MSVKITFNDKVYLPVEEEALVVKKCVIFRKMRQFVECHRNRYLEIMSGIMGQECKPSWEEVSAKIASTQDMHKLQMLEAFCSD